MSTSTLFHQWCSTPFSLKRSSFDQLSNIVVSRNTYRLYLFCSRTIEQLTGYCDSTRVMSNEKLE